MDSAEIPHITDSLEGLFTELEQVFVEGAEPIEIPAPAPEPTAVNLIEEDNQLLTQDALDNMFSDFEEIFSAAKPLAKKKPRPNIEQVQTKAELENFFADLESMFTEEPEEEESESLAEEVVLESEPAPVVEESVSVEEESVSVEEDTVLVEEGTASVEEELDPMSKYTSLLKSSASIRETEQVREDTEFATVADLNRMMKNLKTSLASLGGGGMGDADVIRIARQVATEATADVQVATGGYEFTGGFLNRSNAITYTQEQADAGTWMRFGFSAAKQLTTDAPYWGNGPDPDEAPHAGTTDYQGVGSFSGAYMPSGVTQMIDYDDDTAYNQALTMSVTTAGVVENLPVTAALGSYNFKQYKVGDFANIRVDFNVTPHVSNTTLNCALIWSTRDANDNITFTFPLTITPFFFGDNTAGKQVLTRPIFTAYFASQEDINARALFAIKSDNIITVEPFTSLTTVIAR